VLAWRGRFRLAAARRTVLQSVMPPPAAAATLLRGPSAPHAANRPTLNLPPVHLAAFEGPLDLLLHLVRAGRMDIFDLPIAPLCDQYLAYLRAMEALDLNVAGEFLVMAATLLEIKSRLLLPAPPKEEDEDADNTGRDAEDPRAELVRRLLEYGKYQAIADALKGAEGERRAVFFRPPTDYGREFALPPRFGELSADALLRTLERMLEAVGAGERAVTSVRRQKITLRMKMREVLGYAERAGRDGVLLEALVPEPPFALLEIVLLFLAMLELLKMGSVVVAQEDFCGEIRVFFVPEAERAALLGTDTEGIDTWDDGDDAA
jgi:segregation and condensation protein A